MIPLTDASQAKPFLWGPVKSALIQDTRDHGPGTILKLCYEEEQRVKEMMVAVLTEIGHDNAQLVDKVLHDLLPQEKEPSTFQRAWRLVHKPRALTDRSTQNARKIATEVAGNLSIPWALEAASRHPDPAIRAAAVRAAYHLWQRDPGSGFAMLDTLSTKVLHGLIPDLAAFESTLGLSLSIFFDHYEDPEVLRQLQQIWRRIIAHILGIQERGSRLGQAAREFARERLFALAIDRAFGILAEIPEGFATLTLPELQSFFSLRQPEKELSRRLAHYIAALGDHSLEEMERDWLAATQIPDMFTGRMVGMSTIAHTAHPPVISASFLRRLLLAATTAPVPTTAAAFITSTIAERSLLHPDDDEAFELVEEALQIYAHYFTEHRRIPGVSHIFQAPEGGFFSPYAATCFLRTGTVRTPLIESRIAGAVERNDLEFFEFILTQELPFLGIDMRKPSATLEVLECVEKVLFRGGRRAWIARPKPSFSTPS